MTDYDELAELLKVLGHPVRLQIIDILRRGEVCVCHIEQVLNKRQAYISQQLMILREAGLVTSRKDGLQVHYRLLDSKMPRLLIQLRLDAEDSGHEVITSCRCPMCSTKLTINDPII